MEEKKKGFFSRLVAGLTKTRENIVSGMDSIFSGFSAIDEDFYEELEETLIMGDMGIQTTMSVLEELKKAVKEQHIKDPSQCRQVLIDSIRKKMDLGENAYEFEHRKSVVLVIGVNGVGKTTSIGKLADQLKSDGKRVILAAADTFRAAAIEQLSEFLFITRHRSIPRFFGFFAWGDCSCWGLRMSLSLLRRTRRPPSEMWTAISFKSLEISSWGRTIMEPLKRKQPRTVPNT